MKINKLYLMLPKLWFVIFFGLGVALLIGNADQYYDAMQKDFRLFLLLGWQGVGETIIYSIFLIIVSFLCFNNKKQILLILSFLLLFYYFFRTYAEPKIYTSMIDDRFKMFQTDLIRKCPNVYYENEEDTVNINISQINNLDWKKSTNLYYFIATVGNNRYMARYYPGYTKCGSIIIGLAYENLK